MKKFVILMIATAIEVFCIVKIIRHLMTKKSTFGTKSKFHWIIHISLIIIADILVFSLIHS